MAILQNLRDEFRQISQRAMTETTRRVDQTKSYLGNLRNEFQNFKPQTKTTPLFDKVNYLQTTATDSFKKALPQKLSSLRQEFAGHTIPQVGNPLKLDFEVYKQQLGQKTQPILQKIRKEWDREVQDYKAYGEYSRTPQGREEMIDQSMNLVMGIATGVPEAKGAPVVKDIVAELIEKGLGKAGKFVAPVAKGITKRLQGINLSRLELNPKEMEVIETTLNNIKPQLEKIKGKPLTHAQVLDSAKTAEVLDKVTTRAETKVAEASMLKARQTMTAIDTKLTTLLSKGKNQEAEALFKDFIENIKVVSSTASDWGRKLESLKIQAGEQSLRTQVLKELSGIVQNTDELAKHATKVDWNDARSIADFYRTYKQPNWSEVLDEFRYNNMLSNPKSHLRNILGNLNQAVATRPLTRLFTGDLKGAGRHYVSLVQALPEAIDDFTGAITGKSQIAKPDLERIATMKLPGWYTMPTKFLEGMDVFFQRLIKNAEIANGATAKEAEATAEKYLFRQALDPSNKTGQGYLLSFIDRVSGWVNQGRNLELGGVKPLGWMVPFWNTSLNIGKAMIEYNPVLGLTTLAGNANKGEQLAKMGIGSLVMMAGAKASAEGKVTLAAPTNSKDKALFFASGVKPYSVEINGANIPLQYLGIHALAFALPQMMKERYEESGEIDPQSTSKVVGDALKLWADQTPMDSLEGAIKMVSGDFDYTVPSQLGFTSSQVIPFSGLMRYLAQLVDPVYRKSSGYLGSIRAGIPFASKTNEPYTEPDGSPSMRLGINNLLPYDIGVPNQQSEKYNKQLELRQQESKKRKSLDAAKKAIMQGKALGAFDVKAADESDPLAKALQGEAKKTSDSALIKTIFETYDSREEIDKALKDNDLGSYETAQVTLAKSLGVENGVRPDYIRNLLTGLEGKQYVGVFNYLSENKVLTKSVIEYWVDEGEIDENTGKELKKMLNKALGKSGKKLNLPKPKKVTLPKATKIVSPKFPKSLLEFQSPIYKVQTPKLTPKYGGTSRGLVSYKSNRSLNLPTPSGGTR